MNRIRLTIAALAACGVAGFAFAQNADQNTSGPTRNDYRLHVIQPADGTTIIGNRLEIIVDTEIPTERDTRVDVNTMPRPGVDVFVDGILKGTMRDDKNVVNVEDVAVGPRQIVLLARNRSGEIIDRKEINVVMLAPRVAPAPAAVRPASSPPPRPVPPAPAYAPPPAPPAPVAQPLPKTGTADPLLVAAGLALALAGLAVRRFA